MKPLVYLSIAAALVASAFQAHADEPFRCGKWVVSSDSSPAELTAKCGQPTQRERSTEDVLVRNPSTGLMRKIGETITETWTFNRGTRAAPMVVTIVDGKIKRIERQER